jgi:hypothetical protein
VGAGGLLVGALGPRTALLLAGLGPMLVAAAGLTVLRRPGAYPVVKGTTSCGQVVPSGGVTPSIR